MKKITILILVLGLFSMMACKKDETKSVLKSNPGAPALTLPGGAALVLEKANADAALEYTWAPADYGAKIIPVYTLEMDKEGNNFANAVALGAVSTLTKFSIPTKDLNAKLLPLLFDPTNPEPLGMEFRLKTVVKNEDGNLVDTVVVYSATVKQAITPYYEVIVYPLLQVPGDYQTPNSWSPADSNYTIASVGSNDKYEGYIYFPIDNAQFKYTKGPSWDFNWGDTGANGTLEPNGDNIAGGPAGYYKLNVDLVGLTHTFLRTTWAVIGSATSGGWDNDTPMTYDETNKVWTVTADLSAGEIKFRANGNWDLNYGDDGANGSLEPGAGNISVAAAGNYTIILNLSQPIYKYKLTKN